MKMILPRGFWKAHGQASFTEESKKCKGSKSHGGLVIDCRGCRGKQDLAEERCLKGIVQLLALDFSGIDEIILSREWEIRYSRDCVSNLTLLAEVQRFLLGIIPQRQFDECAKCQMNPNVVAKRIVSSFSPTSLEIKWNIATPCGPHGKDCELCISSLAKDLEHARYLMANARADLYH
jgi:hypothetical protein